MLPESSRTIILTCARCGRAAAEIALLAGQPGSSDIMARRDRLERIGFLGRLARYGGHAELSRLFEALSQNDFVAARQLDPDFIALWCTACGQIYCDTCWQLHAPVFDEGFYDYTRAACPAGHEQIVDD